MEKLTTGRLAKLAGVNPATVRFYENEGLITKPVRTASGYRVFQPDAARRLRFVKRAQELVFSLNEIKDLLALRLTPGTTRADIRARADAKIADIDEKIRALKAIKRTLHALSERCSGCGPTDDCPILDSFDGVESGVSR